MMLVDKFLAEFFGTFIFLAVIITTVDSSNIYDNTQAWIKIPMALIVSILAFGYISGGNFNPVVSLMFFMDNKLTFEELIVYIFAQILGGLMAYFYYVYTNKYLNKKK